MYGVVPLKGRTIEVLSREEMAQVLQAAFEVLKDTGIKVEHEEALDILSRSGAEVDDKNQIAHIPKSVVERAIGQVRPFAFCGRNPNYDIKSGTGEVHFGSGMGATYVLDFETRERRPATKKDLENLVRLHDALENTHSVAPEVIPQDVPERALDRHMTQTMFNNTEKPCIPHVYDGKGTRDLIRMGVAIAGSEEALRRRPIFSASVGVVSPLFLERDRVDVLLELCRFGLPVNIYSIPVAGATAPATLAGTLVVQMAEVLAGVTLTQLVRPGTPVRGGGFGSILDQKYGIFAFGSPENILISTAMAQLLRHYKIPHRSSTT